MMLILCGYQGCGKSTIAKAYAKQFCCDAIDIDEMILQYYGENHGYDTKINRKSIREIHLQLGDEYFRRMETHIIRSLAATNNTIVATGGGAILHEDNRKHLRNIGKIIYLKTKPVTIFNRMLAKTALPSFIDENNIDVDFQNYINSRQVLYETSCHHYIVTDGKNISEIVNLLHEYRCQYGE